MAGGANSLKTVLFALGANFGIAVSKSVAAWITGSGAMLAEAIHSFADCGNQGLLLLGMKQAKKPPSDDYPLGHGKAIYFWSFLVAVMLFSVGGMFSVYEGWHKLHHPEPLNNPWIAVAVLTFGIILESVSMRACVVEVNKIRHGRSYWQWFRESRQSELVVIFGEDLAALLGLVFALVFILLAMVTGNPLFDAIGTLAIGALLLVVAVAVAIEVKAMLVGQSADPVVREGIHEVLRSHPSIDQVLNVFTLHMGDDVMVAVKARMKETDSVAKLAEDINRAEAAVKAAHPTVKWVFFEPDLEA
ncbi:MAG TPA: cation diffusion facilitator family transporter [Nevskiaceae bacterium]|nr:cation diffusion facilitator family transporter [Nevskiaceae bacterium]